MLVNQTTITPELAKEILEGNTKNRPLNKRHVDYLAEQMRSGSWKLNGDTIRLNGETLVDGQHRLHACIKADVPFDTLLVTGVGGDVFDTIDVGRNRSPGDILAINGEKNTFALAATIGKVHDYMSRDPKRSKRVHPSKYESMLRQHPGIRDSLLHTERHRRDAKFITATTAAAYHYLFSCVDRAAADIFFEGVLMGLGLQKGSAALALRQRLINNSISNRPLTQIYINAITIRAWNAFYKGKEITYLRWDQTTPFPKIEGFPDKYMEWQEEPKVELSA